MKNVTHGLLSASYLDCKTSPQRLINPLSNASIYDFLIVQVTQKRYHCRWCFVWCENQTM